MAPTMESPRRSTDDLIARAAEGDQKAWAELFEQSYPKIRRSIRRRMDARLRRRCDSVDIANSVMADFCAKIGQFEFASMQAMHAYLQNAALQKLIDEHRRQNGLKRNVRLERPAEGALEVASNSPTPSQFVVAEEDLERCKQEARSDKERDIIEMKAQGESTATISERTGLSSRSIQRFLERLKKTICV